MADASRDKLRIRLTLYDKEFSVFTPPEDEELYRKSAKLITGLVNKYTDQFKGIKSESEILYMVLLEIAFRYESEARKNDVEPYRDLLSTLTEEIENTLKTETTI